jgi:hypothetical protein
MDLHGCLVCLDVLACRPEIAEQITARGGKYLLALMANRKKAHEEARRWFEANALARGAMLRPCLATILAVEDIRDVTGTGKFMAEAVTTSRAASRRRSNPPLPSGGIE